MALEAEIDHVLCRVADADAAAALFERLGFVTTPTSHMEPMGIANRCVMFPAPNKDCLNFLEFMAVTDPQNVNPVMGEVLKPPSGVRSMVLSGPDAQSAHKTLNQAGFAFAPPVEMERDWVLPTGELTKPAFSVMLPIERTLLFNYCQYRNKAPYELALWHGHQNKVAGMSAVLAASDSPRDSLAPFAELLQSPITERSDGLLVVAPGVVQLAVGEHDQVSALLGVEIDGGERYAGVELISDDLSQTAVAIDKAGISFTKTSKGIGVAPILAEGIGLSIVPRT